MLTTTKTFKDDVCTGLYIFDGSTNSIYIPFGLAIALADSLTFDEIIVPYEMIGYIEIFYDYSGDILLNDGSESVRIEKCEIKEFIDVLWSMV